MRGRKGNTNCILGKQTALVAFVLAMLVYQSPAIAGVADYVDVGSAADQNFATWAIGDGNQSVSDIFCIASANYNNNYPSPPPWWLAWFLNPDPALMPYQFKVNQLAGPAAFYLYLDGDDTNTGNARIPIQFDHRDILAGTAFETLAFDTYDGHSHSGQFRTCTGGNNSEMQLTLPAAQLQQARAGSYQGNFRMSAIGGSSGTAVDTDDFSVSITVSQAVQVSGLSNIDLGTWDGISDILAQETFCVYSNNSTASYSMTISSPNQDASSNFYIVNPGATDQIQYQLQFKDDVSAGAGTTVGGSPLSGNGSNTVPGCGGIDNAKLNVTLTALNLAGASQDTYTDTITLFVVPL